MIPTCASISIKIWWMVAGRQRWRCFQVSSLATNLWERLDSFVDSDPL
jgi:hypothetical protein